jgi:flagellar basal-body rod protein FlgB
MPETGNIADLLEAGIIAESLRQKAIASNIANIETPGYRRVDIRFEELLVEALNAPGPLNQTEIEPQLYQPKQTPVKSNGNDVTLETEIGEMVKNALRHKAYIRLLGLKFKQIDLAIRTNT